MSGEEKRLSAYSVPIEQYMGSPVHSIGSGENLDAAYVLLSGLGITAVLAVLKGEESLEVIARRHGVSSNTLTRWKQEFLDAGRERLRGKPSKVSSREREREAEGRKRDQLIGELVVANELLKKTPHSG